MENAEEVMQILDRFTRLKQKEIPKELDEYLQYVAKTGDTVFKWTSLKYLFREKLLNVIKHFHDTTPRVDEIPQYPNVDPFNYESMKTSLLERLEVFNAAPFTIQRLCELLIDPRKQYSRIDKFMRALEKNILVVSTIEPGRKRTESENGDSLDSVVNGDLSLDVNVDIDMENESLFNMETQNGNGTNASAPGAVESETEPVAVPAAVNDVKEKPVTETPNVPHTADDDVLPNPKKAKLDIDVAAAEEAAVKNSLVEKVEVEAKSSSGTKTVEKKDDRDSATETEKSANTVSAAVVADSADVDMQETDKNKDNLNETEKEVATTETKVTEAVSDKLKTLDKEETKDIASSKESKSEEIVKKHEDSIIATAGVNEQKESEVVTITKVEIEKETVAIKKIDKPAEETEEKQEEPEKVIEKQEIEEGEKEKTTEPKRNKDNVDRKLKNDKSTADEHVKKGEKEEVKQLLPEVATDSEIIEENEIIVKVKDKTDAVEETVTASATKLLEATAAEKPTTANIESKAAEVTEDIPKQNQTVVLDKIDTATVELANQSTKDSSAVVKANKEESVSPTAEISTAIEKVDAEKTEEIHVSEKEVSITLTTAVVVEKIPSGDTTDVSSPTQTASTDVANEEATASSTTTQIAEDVSPETTIAAEETTAKDAIETKKLSTASITPVPTPTLALNDQPMEENTADVPLEDIPVNNVVSPTAVEEVVMAEASSGGTTEMATDAIEPAKDEPAGMEVDDTSQEAMDQ